MRMESPASGGAPYAASEAAALDGGFSIGADGAQPLVVPSRTTSRTTADRSRVSTRTR